MKGEVPNTVIVQGMWQPPRRLARWVCEVCGGVCTGSWWTVTEAPPGGERMVWMNLVCEEHNRYTVLKGLHERKCRSYLARSALRDKVVGKRGMTYGYTGNGTHHAVAKS
jgi:hypothetical protein